MDPVKLLTRESSGLVYWHAEDNGPPVAAVLELEYLNELLDAKYAKDEFVDHGHTEPEDRDEHKVHRCTECGKWSHAKRRPRHHRRFILNGSDPEHPEWTAENIAAYLELETDEVVQPMPWSGDPEEDEDPGGAWVKCGPFATYTAMREDMNANA